MDIAAIVTSLDPWILFFLIVIICVVFAELGSLVAHRRAKTGVKEPDAAIGTAVGGMMALLAFMLGLTFSITASRFADRKELVITQANAIGTCYLRTSFIPENQKQEIRKLFREYVAILTSDQTEVDVDKAVTRLEKIHLFIWKQTASLKQENMDSEIRTLFVSSVNKVIDIAEERKTVALVFRIPSVFWISLFILTALCMFSIGYQIGTQGTRRILDLPLLAAAFSVVFVMIAAMDSSGPKRFKVSQKPLLDVQQMMKEDIP